MEVEELLGRPPRGRVRVVVRMGGIGRAIVVESAPLFDDGTPMPTLYWLVDPRLKRAVSELESAGWVRRAEQLVDPDMLQSAHDQYRALRDSRIPATHRGPRPSGGVGGTRRGVKCLHAHLAYFLVGGDDPVGRLVAEMLDPSIGEVEGIPQDGLRGGW